MHSQYRVREQCFLSRTCLVVYVNLGFAVFTHEKKIVPGSPSSHYRNFSRTLTSEEVTVLTEVQAGVSQCRDGSPTVRESNWKFVVALGRAQLSGTWQCQIGR